MKTLYSLTSQIGDALLFLLHTLRIAVRRPCQRRTLFNQIYLVTVESISTSAFAGFFVGAILAVQFNLQLKEFGALGVLGGLCTSATVRELGPLLIAFLLSGKIGAYTAAELGTMRVTEQIDAMKCLGMDPIQHLVVPRFLAIIVSGFFLLLSGLLTSIAGGVFLSSVVAHLNPEEYLSAIPTFVHASSVVSGLIKCFCFSILLATVCTYKGYTTTGGARGVGRSVIATSMSTMVGLVVLDWLTSYIFEAATLLMGVGHA